MQCLSSVKLELIRVSLLLLVTSITPPTWYVAPMHASSEQQFQITLQLGELAQKQETKQNVLM